MTNSTYQKSGLNLSVRRLTVAFIALISLISAVAAAPTNRWPEHDISPDMQLVASRAVAEWIKNAPQKLSYYQHAALGLYLHRGKSRLCEEAADRPFDDRGIPMLVWNGESHYHPYITATCGLNAFNHTILTGEAEAEVRLLADELITLQDERGAFQYPFAWHHYLSQQDLEPGWASAIAQGRALSLFARAYSLFGDKRYLDAGRKALQYLITPVDRGGVMTTLHDLDPSLSDFIFFEEYVSKPSNYVLNGYMFALIGLYDWSKLPDNVEADQSLAATYFDKGIDTLIHLLPYYDLGNISSYDLGYITFKKRSKVKTGYHILHILQLRVLQDLNGHPQLKFYAEKWWGYVMNPVIPERFKEKLGIPAITVPDPGTRE